MLPLQVFQFKYLRIFFIFFFVSQKLTFNISQDLIRTMWLYLMDIGTGNLMIPNSMTHMVKPSDPRIMDMMIAPQPEYVYGVSHAGYGWVRWGPWLSGRCNKLLGLK